MPLIVAALLYFNFWRHPIAVTVLSVVLIIPCALIFMISLLLPSEVLAIIASIWRTTVVARFSWKKRQ